MASVTKAVLGTVFAQVAEHNSLSQKELETICRRIKEMPQLEGFTYDPGNDIVLVEEIGMRWPGHLGIEITTLHDDIAVFTEDGMAVVGRLPGDDEKVPGRWDALTVAMQSQGVMLGSPALLVVNYDPDESSPPAIHGPGGELVS